jgi:Carboxypeptidase regulatory-like domain
MRLVRFASVLILAGLFAANMVAQSKKGEPSTRSVQGVVQDPEEKPVSGAVVQLKDGRTLQVRSFISQSDGGYHFTGLKVDNDYQLKADYNGMTSGWKTLSVFDSRSEPVINLKLEKK